MSASLLRTRTLNSYARLLRAQRYAFGKDYKTREKALEQSRAEFRKNASVTDPAKIEDLINQSEAVSDFLVTNLIQAQQTGVKAFSVKIPNNVMPSRVYEPITAKKEKPAPAVNTSATPVPEGA